MHVCKNFQWWVVTWRTAHTTALYKLGSGHYSRVMGSKF